MSKSKNKNRSELEYLRGQLKSVQSENRQLRKQLKQLERRSHFYEEVIDNVVEDVDLDTCNNCGKGVLQVLDLKYVQFVHCNLCDYRERISDNVKKDK